MRRLLRALVPILAVLLPVALAAPAAAHPLGNFTVNTYAGLLISRGTVRVDHVIDMAEIPTFQELRRIDRDHDGRADETELAAWAAARAEEIAGRLALTIDGRRIPLHPDGAHAYLLDGQGGLNILRLETRFTARIPERGVAVFEDGNLTDRVGWREITVAGAPGVRITDASVPTASVSERLRAYPSDLLANPLRVTRATFSFQPGAGTAGTIVPEAGQPTEARPATDTGLAGLVARTGGFPVAPPALLLAFGFGALHALGPGHGKALVATYLVGGGGRIRDAVRVGLAVAAMHCASVLLLGSGILLAGRSFAPERAYPWLSTIAGACAATLGLGLFVSRLRHFRATGNPLEHPHRHPHRHPHPHPHPHAERSVGQHGSGRGLVPIALAGGILPSPSALVTLLASIALGRLGLGLTLIAAFSIGLATTLVGVGILALKARSAMDRRVTTRWWRAVPVASAALLLIAGTVIALRGLTAL